MTSHKMQFFIFRINEVTTQGFSSVRKGPQENRWDLGKSSFLGSQIYVKQLKLALRI